MSAAGVVTALGLAPANTDERPVADALIAADGFDAYLAGKGLASAAWEARWRDAYGARVAAKITAPTAGQCLNRQHGRPMRQLGDLLV